MDTSELNRRTFLTQTAGAAAAMALVPSLSGALGRLAAPVRVGVVGCGRQGRSIIAELSSFPDAELVAIADVEPRRLRAGQRRAPGAKTYARIRITSLPEGTVSTKIFCCRAGPSALPVLNW